ncbi:MAG TPA: hypothetical protein VLI94_06355 [Solirubrobacterales bacterium]|nr:hypothetical protein [Solirubrobacterales bacterium]
MKQIRKRLTYANVMSSIAVFLILGGATAFAAVQLGKNTVGSKQLKKNAVTTAKIKKNAVTTAKIKNDAVTGAKVNEATLGTVPSAALASSIPPAEPTHIVGAPGQPPFEGGASSNPGESGLGFNPVGFYKDHEGIVHLQGIAIGGASSFIFTLPPGFRPAANKLIVQEQILESTAIIAGTGVVTSGIDISGKVLGAEGKAVVLDGITFRAEG